MASPSNRLAALGRAEIHTHTHTHSHTALLSLCESHTHTRTRTHLISLSFSPSRCGSNCLSRDRPKWADLAETLRARRFCFHRASSREALTRVPPAERRETDRQGDKTRQPREEFVCCSIAPLSFASRFLSLQSLNRPLEHVPQKSDHHGRPPLLDKDSLWEPRCRLAFCNLTFPCASSRRPLSLCCLPQTQTRAAMAQQTPEEELQKIASRGSRNSGRGRRRAVEEKIRRCLSLSLFLSLSLSLSLVILQSGSLFT